MRRGVRQGAARHEANRLALRCPDDLRVHVHFGRLVLTWPTGLIGLFVSRDDRRSTYSADARGTERKKSEESDTYLYGRCSGSTALLSPVSIREVEFLAEDLLRRLNPGVLPACLAEILQLVPRVEDCQHCKQAMDEARWYVLIAMRYTFDMSVAA